MKTLVLLFALIGAALALVPGKQYKYQYEGRIGVGLPDIRSRFAGAGLRCTVNVQVQTEEDVVIKLDDVQVGEYQGDIANSRDPLPINYKDIDGEGKNLTDPYLIHIQRDQDEVMLIPKFEKEWITNIRKSIAGLFLIEPLRNTDEPAGARLGLRQLPFLRIREPSIFGECDADYNLARLDEPQSRRQDKKQSNDDEKYTMSRSINFDSCQESVALQQTSVGNTTLARENQFGDVSSRSSKMCANLTYDGDRYTLQEGATEGRLSVNPFGLDQDKVEAIVNQTYKLQSVQDIQTQWVVPSPSKGIKTWYMEAASPFTASDSSPAWINFYNSDEDLYRPLTDEIVATGIPVEQADIDRFKGILDQRLDDSANILQSDTPKAHKDENQISPVDSDLALLATHMEIAFRLVKLLDDKATQDLFDKYDAGGTDQDDLKQRLLVDAIGVAGTGGPLRVFVDNAQRGKIPAAKAASVFWNLPNTLITVPILPDLERYVKSISLDKDPFSTATVWINYASTVNKVCLNDRRSRYSTPHELFGKKDCDNKGLIDSILPFYQDQLQKADEDWKRIVLLHAISNLGAIQAHSTFLNIVKDRRQVDTVRVTAIYGLARNKLPDGIRDHVFRTLRPIVERRDEDPYVRQAAVIALLSWKPPPSFLQSLAASTWSEPSDNMASFIYSILRSYAESTDPAIDKLSKVAKFALPLAKQYAPSRRYSDSKLFSKYSQQDELATDFDVSWLKRDRAGMSYKEEVFAFLLNSLGGLRYSVAQGSLSFNHDSVSTLIRNMAHSLPREFSNVRSSDNRRAQDQLLELQKRMNQRQRGKQQQQDSSDYSIAFLSLFDNMELLLPLSKEPLKKEFAENGSALRNWIQNGKFNGTKFLNPGPQTLLLPSEIGLPMFVRVSSPTVNGADAQITLSCDDKDCADFSQLMKAKEIRLKAKNHFKITSKVYTTIRALLPWSQRAASAGVEAMKAVALPADFSLSISKSQPLKNISVSFIPSAKDEFIAVQVQTVPFVIVKSMWPDEDPNKPVDKEQVVSINGDGSGTIMRERPLNMSFTGISGKSRYEGDFANPFTLGNYIDLMRRPEEIPSLLVSPTSRMYEAVITLDFSKSETKEIHSSVAFRTDAHSANDGRQQQRQKRERQQSTKLEDVPNLEVDGNLLLNGTKSRYHEASLKMSHSSDGQQEKMELSISHQRNPLPDFDPKPKSHCLDLKSTGPSIQSLDDLRRVLQKDAEVDYEATLDEGTASCHEQHVASMSGKVQLSEERRKRLQEELDEDCNSDPNNPMVSLHTAPVYDQASFDITYDDKSVPRDIRNASYHVYDFLRGQAFPHVYFNYMDQKNQQGKISLRGNRYIGEKRWEVEVKLPTETSRFDRLKMPKQVESIVPVGGLSAPRDRFDTPVLVAESQLSHECVITKSKVRAFDGFSYNYATDHCDTNAFVNRDDRDQPHFMAALDYDTQDLKGLVGSSGTGTTIVFTSKMMTVDNTELGLTQQPTVIKDSRGRYFAEALKTPTYIQVKIPGNFTVRVADDKISITPSDNLRNKAGGLCGDYNGAIRMELIGEQKCIYDDPKLFGESWAEYSGAGCEWDQFRQEQENVEKFRKHCQKLPDEKKQNSILAKYSSIPDDCIEHVYKIKKDDGAICVTKDVVATCYPLCKVEKQNNSEEAYDCWPESSAPKELARNLNRGFIRHKIHQRGSEQRSLKTEHADMCSRK